ncbi:MAG: hypothetical protein WAX04_02855, partial [Oscillospiraceae bacterium]
IYYASETIAVGTVVEVINPTEIKGRPYSNFNVSLRINGLLKGTLTLGNEPPYLNIYQNKSDFKNHNGNYLKNEKEYLLFCGATFPTATNEIRLINPLQGALEVKKDHIVKNKYSKMLGIDGKSVTEVMEQIRSLNKPISCAPEIGTLPNLDEPVSSEVAPTAKKAMPIYPVFENTDWGMTQDEVLSALSLTKSDWSEVPDPENDGTRLQFIKKSFNAYGKIADVLFVFSADSKHNIGLIEIRIACDNEESVKAIKQELNKKYKSDDSNNNWKTGSIVSKHPKWDLLQKAIIKETDEKNTDIPKDKQISVKDTIPNFGKLELATIGYLSLTDDLKNGKTGGVFYFGGYNAAWANSME